MKKSSIKDFFADKKRIDKEVKLYKKNPQEYINKNNDSIGLLDFPVFAATNIYITNKRGRKVPFEHKRVQRKLWQWLLEDIQSKKPVRWYIVKARQLGLSTWIIALYYWLASQNPNKNVLILAHEQPAVHNFRNRISAMHAEIHPALKSDTSKDSRDLITFGNNYKKRKNNQGAGLNSNMVFKTAASKELGRSFNFQYVLESEFCIWPELKIDLDEQLGALNACIDESPGTIIIRESTAKGENKAKELWDKNIDGYRKIFLSWVSDDEYREDIEIKQEFDLCASEEEGGLQTRYGNEFAEARLIEQELKVWYEEESKNPGWLQKEILARLNWRRKKIDKFNGNKLKFRQEFPTCAEHAFTSTSKTCFDSVSIEEQYRFNRENPIKLNRVEFINNDNLKTHERFIASPVGKVFIYEKPLDDCEYVIGADTSMGMNQVADPSALIVLKVPEMEEVASYNSIVKPNDFALILYYLGLLYNNALLGVENNERGGAVVNNKLWKDLNYPRLFFREDRLGSKVANQPGFITDKVNKSVGVSKVDVYLRNQGITLRNEFLLAQLEKYSILDNEKLGAPKGYHDDLVSALLIAVQLAEKIHKYPQVQEEYPPGTMGYEMKQRAKRRGIKLVNF